jgi:hypothetical protein
MARLCLSILGILLLFHAKSQDTVHKKNDSLSQLPDKFYGRVCNLIDETEEQLTRKTAKYLSRLKKQEIRLKRKIGKLDSLAAENLFSKSISQYDDFQMRFDDKSHQLQSKAKTYLPFLDTLKTSFKFLEQYQQNTGNIENTSKEIAATLEKIKGLDEKLKQADIITVFIRERKALLKEKLLSFGMAKEGLKFQKEAYYYAKQVQEYKAILNQPDKLIEKSISLLTKVPIFKEFMSKHSDLATLFPMPVAGSFPNSGNVLQLQGLQTRVQVQNLVQNNLGGSGPNAQQVMQQGIQSARQQLDLLKSKINLAGGSNSDLDMPEGFMPNNQRTKKIWERLEWGVNLQSTRSTAYWPITTDIGTSVGFKINDRSILGLGLAVKMGWGKDIKHIVITSQGAGLRSFLDWKVKGKIFITGGAELNYRNEIKSLVVLKDYSSWQRSALVGATMKYKAGKKWKGNIQLLYDALWKEQLPRTQPVIFRTGYNF